MNDPRVSLFVTDPLPDDVKQSVERTCRLNDVVRIAVMPDVHLAGEFCVGCVVATRNTIYPHAVGGDIGCGVAAVPLDSTHGTVDIDSGRAVSILRGLKEDIPIMSRVTPLRAPNLDGVLDEVLDDPLSRSDLDRLRRKDAPRQLGTLGRGNHFLELQRSDHDDRLWLCVHTGSRGIGPAIRDTYAPGGRDGLPANSTRGRAYLHDLGWARRFADKNRMAILALASNVIGDVLDVRPAFDECISSDHNHVDEERLALTDEGTPESAWIHRKGAVDVPVGNVVIVPGSAGSATFHVEGRGSNEGLSSSAHGAGRRLARAAARKEIRRRDVERAMRDVWFDRSRADALREEAPSAYKDIDRVMRAQRKLVRVIRKLRPVLNFKGS